MRRIFASLAFLAIAVNCLAIPAMPGFRRYTQPDGKTFTLELRGDEWGSWYADAAGNNYTMDRDGYFRRLNEDSFRQMNRMAARRRNFANGKRAPEVNDMTHGSRRIPVILVQFSDTKFRIDNPVASFDALLNSSDYQGYQGNGATGSVNMFYQDNSGGQFNPIFDVFGPVTLSNTLAYYGEQVYNEDGTLKAHDRQPHLALYDAFLKLDDTVDFSKYDHNGDGVIDMVLFYYAGGSQAEGWPTDAIWPHQWFMSASGNTEIINHRFDGVALNRYFCTAELKGSQNDNTMCSIGPTCHEFAHSLGLPDFYDTGSKPAGHKSAGTLIFDTMCDGPYNDESRTPPYFGAEERIMLGWLDPSDVEVIKEGDYTLRSIEENVALMSLTSVEGEYFIYEKRGGDHKWDKPLPEGMVVYHADRSEAHVLGGLPAKIHWDRWDAYNDINAYEDHPCFYVVIPSDQNNYTLASSQLKYGYQELVFPGYYKVDTYCPVDWEGVESDYVLLNIVLDGDVTRFSVVSMQNDKTVSGVVRGTDSQPLQGVSVTLYSVEEDEPAGMSIRIRKLSSAIANAETDADGAFSFHLENEFREKFCLTLSKEGYVEQSRTIDAAHRAVREYFTLRGAAEIGESSELSFFSANEEGKVDLFYRGEPGVMSAMVSQKCPYSYWGAFEGLKIQSVKFLTYQEAKANYFILHSGDGVTGIKATNPRDPDKMTTIDLSEKDIRIPSGDFYLGYAVEEAVASDPNYQYPLILPSGAGCFCSGFSLENPQWLFYPGYSPCMTITVTDPDYEVVLTDLGYTYINIPSGTLSSGDKLPLKLEVSRDNTVESVKWTLDGNACEGESVTLSAGWHTLVASVTFTDGHTEVIERELEVK